MTNEAVEVVSDRYERLKDSLIYKSLEDEEARMQRFINLFNNEYERDERAFVSDVERGYRELYLGYLEEVRRKLYDPAFEKGLEKFAAGVNGENYLDYNEDVLELLSLSEEMIWPYLFDVEYLQEIYALDPSFLFLREVEDNIPSLVYLMHDFQKAELAYVLSDFRDLLEWSKSDELRDFIINRAKQLHFFYSHAKSVFESFVTEVKGEQVFEEADFYEFIIRIVDMLSARFEIEIEGFYGNEAEIANMDSENKIFVRIDKRLKNQRIKMDINRMFRYFWNLFKNTKKEIGEDSGWMVCDVRLSKDERVVFVENIDSGQGFNVDVALKSVIANMSADPVYGDYLRRELGDSVVDVLEDWGTNVYAIERLPLPYSEIKKMFLLDRISGRGAVNKGAGETSGIGLASMNRTMNAHNGFIILGTSPHQGVGAQILTGLPTDPEAFGDDDRRCVRDSVEREGLDALCGDAGGAASSEDPEVFSVLTEKGEFVIMLFGERRSGGEVVGINKTVQREVGGVASNEYALAA